MIRSWYSVGLGAVFGDSCVALLVRDRSFRIFGEALSFSIVTFIVPLWVRGVRFHHGQRASFIGSRYVETPILLLISVLLVEPERVRVGTQARYGLVGLALCGIILLPAWVVDFRWANLRSASPTWASEVRLGSLECKRHASTTALLKTSPPGWYVEIPCSASTVDKTRETPSHAPIIRNSSRHCEQGC